MNRKSVVIFVVVYAFLMILVLVTYLLDATTFGETLVLLLILAAGLALSLLFQHLAGRRAANTVGLLHEGRDPDPFIDQTRRLLDRAAKWGRSIDVSALRLNLSAGLVAAGRYQEALSTLPDPSLFKSNRTGRMLQFICHNNYFDAFIHLGMTDAARQALVLMYGGLGETTGRELDRLHALYRINYAAYNMALGRFDGAEAVFRNAFDHAPNSYERVSAMLDLGKIHAHFGRVDAARAAFEYVIAHGHKLYAVAQARKELEALDT